MMLWFMLQAINFGYSLLQLSGWIECPRHRMPRNKSERRLDIQHSHHQEYYTPSSHLFNLLRKFNMVYVERVGQSTVVNNMTLMNWVLLIFGPMHEAELCACLLVLQAMWCAVGMCIRHPLGQFFYSI